MKKDEEISASPNGSVRYEVVELYGADIFKSSVTPDKPEPEEESSSWPKSGLFYTEDSDYQGEPRIFDMYTGFVYDYAEKHPETDTFTLDIRNLGGDYTQGARYVGPAAQALWNRFKALAENVYGG